MFFVGNRPVELPDFNTITRTLSRMEMRNPLFMLLFRVMLGVAVAVGGGTGVFAQVPVGTWTDYLPYSDALETVYCGEGGETGFWASRTAGAVFTYRMDDHTVHAWSKVSGLSGSNPTALGWDPELELLLVGYSNGLIDWLAPDGTVIFTLTDIRDSNLIGSKSINQFGGPYPNRQVVAACAFGMVALEADRRYVIDTWYPEGSGSPRNVHEVHLQNGQWIAATDRGIFEAPENHPFLSSPDAWSRWVDVPLELGDYPTALFTPDGRPILHLRDENGSPENQVWVNSNGVWQPLPGYEGITVRALTAASVGANWRLAVADWNAILQYDADFNPIKLDYSAAGNPLRVNDMHYHHAIDADGNPSFRDLFIANGGGGLLRMDLFDEPRDEHWAPAGPPVSAVRSLDCWNDACWVASGAVDGAWTSLYFEHGMFGMVEGEWIEIPAGEGSNDVAGVRDFMTVSIDPTDPDHVFYGSWEDGVFELQAGQIIHHHTPENSTLQAANFGGSLRTGAGGLDFDLEGNLWVTNAFATEPLHVYTREGEWVSMDLEGALGSSAFLEHVLAARNGYIWAVIPRGGGVLVYDPAGTPGDISDDDWRVLTKESVGLPTNNIICLEEDLDGEIWMGTETGPVVVYLPSAIFDSGFDGDLANAILIQQDGNNQYLLETEVVTSICIDGGNRKWIGTQSSGAYLIEADGLDLVAHFTTDSSPLLSNNVYDIAINHRTGEVFFGTEKGLESLAGEATNFVAEIDELTVFPNPVRTDFTGPITIDGCAYGSTVHVTDVGGRWIATLDSEGGRAIWDGNGKDGSPAPFGVYLIFVTDAKGKSAGVTKLAITR